MHRIIRCSSVIYLKTLLLLKFVVCYLYHAVTYDGVTVHVTFLEFLHDDVVTQASSSSTCITALWKFGSNSCPTASIGFTPIASSVVDQLAVYLFHSLYERLFLLLFGIRLRVPAQNCPPSEESFLPRSWLPPRTWLLFPSRCACGSYRTPPSGAVTRSVSSSICVSFLSFLSSFLKKPFLQLLSVSLRLTHPRLPLPYSASAPVPSSSSRSFICDSSAASCSLRGVRLIRCPAVTSSFSVLLPLGSFHLSWHDVHRAIFS